MIITTKEIELKLRKDFPSVYKRFGNFIDSGYIWDTIIDVINDSTLMNHIIYANDVLLIPPVRCHLLTKKDILKNISGEDRKAIGACYGFIFKEIFKYSQQQSISCILGDMKTATRFSNPSEPVKVI